MRERVIGIDFSADARNAGRQTRIATATISGKRASIDA